MSRTHVLLKKNLLLVNMNVYIRDLKSYLSHVSIVGY